MDISGKVIQILPKQTGAGKNGPWEKQDYVIEIQGTYPKKVCFNLWGNFLKFENYPYPIPYANPLPYSLLFSVNFLP
jgi:hypothetical protein